MSLLDVPWCLGHPALSYHLCSSDPDQHVPQIFLGAAANVGVTEIKFTFTASVGYKKASKIMSDGKSGMSIAVA